MSSGEECHVISFHVKYVFARRQFEAVKKFGWNWNNFQWLSTINSRQRSESNYFCANFSPTQVKWGHKAQTAKQKERKHIIRVVFNIDQTSYVYYNILLQMVPLGSSSSSYARPVPMNGNDCRTGWMNDWMDSPFWLKPSMLRSIQVRTNEWDSVLDCNEMGRSRKSPSLKSTWQQLICVARSLVVISIHSPHFSRQDCMSIRTKKGNFQLVLVSFKRHECDASLLLSKPMHCSQAESQETQSPICFALLSPCQPPPVSSSKGCLRERKGRDHGSTSFSLCFHPTPPSWTSCIPVFISFSFSACGWYPPMYVFYPVLPCIQAGPYFYLRC